MPGVLVHGNRSRGGNAVHPIRTQGFFWLVNLFIAGVPIGFDLIADFFQAIRITLDTYVVSKNAVMPGSGCNAPGLFINIGDVGSAWWTFVITLHTFLVLAGGPNIRGWVAEKSVGGKSRRILCVAL